MATRTVDLLRHGQYGEDGRLTSIGIAQIELLGARYRDEGSPTELWASPLPRAQHTGELLAASLGLERKTVNNLAECLPSAPDPVPDSVAHYDAEVFEKGMARMTSVLNRITKRARGSDKHVVLACHGNVTRYLWTRAIGGDAVLWWNLDILHGSRTRFVVRADGSIKGVCFNDVGHLPTALQTGTLIAPKP